MDAKEEALRLVEALRPYLRDVIGTDTKSAIRTAPATVISADNDSHTAVVRQIFSDTNMNLWNCTGKTLTADDSVIIMWFGSQTNAWIGIKNDGLPWNIGGGGGGGGYTKFLGVTTTPLTDGASTNPILINGAYVTAESGDITTYQEKEFIFNGSVWQEFGDLSGLGALAFKDSATATYTPAGSVSQPTFTGNSSTVSITASADANGNYTPAGTISAPTISVSSAGSTTTIKNPTSVTVAKTVVTATPAQTDPSNNLAYWSYDSASETLTLNKIGYTTGASITTSNVTVKNGDASYTASQPTFSGTKAKIAGTVTPTGTVSQPTFSGTQATITAS